LPELLVRNGYVYDPLNNVNGEKMDIAIRNGVIVDSVGSSAEIVDGSGMIVMPGGVDVHSHIAGSKVNLGRMIRPEDHEKDVETRTSNTRSGVGRSIPSTFTTGYRYARMGYTTVFEPATPPMKTRHTHEELNDTPMLDKGCFPLLGNNWFVMEYLRDGKFDECAAYVAWMMKATKGYAIKLVNPGGVEAWGWGKYVTSLDDTVPRFNITPREIIRGLCKVNLYLKLPHSIHVHTNNLARAGNYETTIETMDCVRDLYHGGRPIIHITHVQFTGRSGTDWINVGSGAPEIADYVNKHEHVDIDLGQIIFTDTTTMTADGGFQFLLYLISGNKWANTDVEVEDGGGIVPFHYKKSNYVNCIQWGIGLELALMIKDPWRVQMTTDHPNAGPFTEYPRVIAWLMSKEARLKIVEKLNKSAHRRLNLPGLDREYSFYDIAIATRAGTAKTLGLKQKGHLGLGADGDISIYAIDPTKINPSKQYKLVRRAFRKAAYTIKEGKILVKNGEIVDTVPGKTFWVDPKVPRDIHEKMLTDLKGKFEDYYTMQMSNYPIDEHYLLASKRIDTVAGSSS
jgi:formylmethanofuran dehydrogenase subunit A